MVISRELLHKFQVAVFIEEFAFSDTFNTFEHTCLKDNVFLVIDNSLEFFCRHTEEISDFIRGRTEIPDVSNWNDELDVTGAFTSYFFLGNFNAATVADDTLITDTFVLTAMAFIVLNRAENTFAEQSIAFRFVSTIVYCFRFKNFSIGSLEDFLGRS